MRRKSTCVFGAQVTFGIIATISPSKLFRNCSSLLCSLVILILNRCTLYFIFLTPFMNSLFGLRRRPTVGAEPRGGWCDMPHNHPNDGKPKSASTGASIAASAARNVGRFIVSPRFARPNPRLVQVRLLSEDLPSLLQRTLQEAL